MGLALPLLLIVSVGCIAVTCLVDLGCGQKAIPAGGARNERVDSVENAFPIIARKRPEPTAAAGSFRGFQVGVELVCDEC